MLDTMLKNSSGTTMAVMALDHTDPTALTKSVCPLNTTPNTIPKAVAISTRGVNPAFFEMLSHARPANSTTATPSASQFHAISDIIYPLSPSC
ncbi:hypothetical protein G1C98_1682 [Bifidobacterium sp. DSM 109960]|uniref:Uncharacterized protein n=1 Tax=Bifidobacterium erythrocebi TaxID=2675325 RepID=A0A7Y0EV20_9BIFI|nr:hypothetical protein [Bifidobacterium sp. DSM 109960]